jgi:hypothetical protein
MKMYCLSKSGKAVDYSNEKEANHDLIHLFTQFFIHRDPIRAKEIRFCLLQNQKNPNVNTIHLLGERIYTMEELGLKTMDKIVQTDIGRRLKFSDVFSYIRTQDVQGYHILLNSDICFANDALDNLRKTDIHVNRRMFALLRYEFLASNPENSPIFGPRYDSQDTWIFHSAHPIPKDAEKAFAFDFGRPGCDNKLVYLVSILGYEPINDPILIKTYHVHSSQARDYSAKDTIMPPWSVLVPHGCDPRLIPNSMGYNMAQIGDATRGFQEMQFADNTVLRNFIETHLSSGAPFLIPSINPVANNLAVYSRLMREHKLDHSMHQRLYGLIKETLQQIGPSASTVDPYEVSQFSDEYLNAFEIASMVSGPSVQDACIPSINYSYQWTRAVYPYPNKQWIWSGALEVYHYLYSNPWTHALRGKRVLIVSSIDSTRLKSQIEKGAAIYNGHDLFPECEIKILQYISTYEQCRTELDGLNGEYDVALVDVGLDTNRITRYIYKICGKSAISCDQVLPAYFGIFGVNMVQSRPDVLRMYLNEAWTRT